MRVTPQVKKKPDNLFSRRPPNAGWFPLRLQLGDLDQVCQLAHGPGVRQIAMFLLSSLKNCFSGHNLVPLEGRRVAVIGGFSGWIIKNLERKSYF